VRARLQMIRRDRTTASGDAAVSIGGNALGPVTTTSIDTQIVGMSLMPLATAAKDPRPVFTAADVGAFTGREWLSDEVDRFIAGNPCGYVFVEAEAGLGKTAFAAWLVKTRGYLSHFSRYSGGSSVQVALANLSAQLIIEFGRAGRGHHRRHRAPAAPGVLAPPVHDTPHPDPLRDLLADILPEQLIRPAAPRAAPLAPGNVVDLLLGVQMLMPAPAMPRQPRPLTPAPPARSAAAPTPVVIPAAGRLPASSRLTGIAPLARGAEQHPAQRHHPLLQRRDLLPLRGHRPGQRRALLCQPRVLRRQLLRPLTPEHRPRGGRPGTSWRDHRAKAAPPIQLVFSTAAPRVASARRDHRILTARYHSLVPPVVIGPKKNVLLYGDNDPTDNDLSGMSNLASRPPGTR
jgi:hypothetical protein